MMKKNILGIGAGGHGQVIAECIKRSGQYQLHSWIDSNEAILNQSILGAKVIGNDESLLEVKKQGIECCFIGVGSIGNTRIRQTIAKKTEDIGFDHPIIIDPSSIVSAYSRIARGTCIFPMSIVNTNTTIDEYAIINSGAIIEHDSSIGAFVHIAPSATLAANVQIGDHSHIGAGAIIKEGVKIGSNVMVGAGAVVLNDVEDHLTVAGCPATPLTKSN